MLCHVRKRTFLAVAVLALRLGGPGVAWGQEETRSAADILDRATRLEEEGDAAGALREYQILVERHPDMGDLHVKVGLAHSQLDQEPEAIRAYKRALEVGNLSDAVGVRFLLAVAQFKSGDIEGAASGLVKIVDQQPENMQALQLLATCYLQMQQSDKVVSLLSPRNLDPEREPRLAYLLGTALIQEGDVKKGDRLLTAYLRQNESAEARFLLGRSKLMAGDYFGAERELKRAIELNPSLPFVNVTYGKLLRVMTRQDEADEAFVRELKVNPNDYDSNLLHGLYLYEIEQRYDQALTHFRKALAARPGDAATRFQIGLVYSSLNRLEESLREVKAVVDENPDFLEGHVTLTRLYYRLGKEEEAARHQQIAENLRRDESGQELMQQGHLSEALQLFDRQKKSDPSNPQPYFLAAMALGQMENWKEAAGELEKALELDPGNLRYRLTYANALVRLGQSESALEQLTSLDDARIRAMPPPLVMLAGETYFRAGQYDRALGLLDGLNPGEGRDSGMALLRAQIYLSKGDYGSASARARESLSFQPQNNAPAYSILGSSQYQLGDREGARASFLAAVEQAPENADYLAQLSAVLIEQGDKELAVKYLERARSAGSDSPQLARLFELATGVGAPAAPVAPDNPDPTSRVGASDAEKRIEEGESALLAGEAGRAIAAFEDAVRLDPENWTAHSMLADILLSQGKLDAAYGHLRKMENIRPDSVVGLHMMAQYFYQRGELQRALQYALRSAEGDSPRADLHNLLGNLYFSLGQFQDAVDEYAAAVRMEPERSEFQLNLQAARKSLR